MSIMEGIADDLAQKALDVEAKSGDETIIRKVADAIGNSSPTMQEAFLTAIRVRRGDRRAHELLDAELERLSRGLPSPEA